MSRYIWIETQDDCRWLREVHLPKDAPDFASAILFGNDDCPDKIELYSATEPLVTDNPVATYLLTDELEYRRG